MGNFHLPPGDLFIAKAYLLEKPAHIEAIVALKTTAQNERYPTHIFEKYWKSK